MSRKKRGLLGRKRARSSAQSEASAPAPELPPPSPPAAAPDAPADASPDRSDAPAPVADQPVAVDPIVAEHLAAQVASQPVAPTIVPVTMEAPPDEDPEPQTESNAPPEGEPVRLQPGDMLGQWIIESDIGTLQGCRLFRAHHKDTQRIRVVLKVLCTSLGTNPNLVREGELLFALKHPNVASVRNLKLTHVPPYLEMDELPGDRLDHMLGTSQIFMAQALDLIEQLLGALVYLHARDIFHRDIQPANLMVRQNGVLTLMGFAHTFDPERPTPPPQSALGYLPPEWPDVGSMAQADLYATGCLLYELLTGRSPFDAPVAGRPLTVATVLHKKKALPFLDPGDRFQEDLRAVVRMLTSNESSGRFPSAATALGRLQRVERSYAT